MARQGIQINKNVFVAENSTAWYVAVEAEGSNIVGTVAMAASIVFLILIVLLDTLTWTVHFYYMKENLQDARVLFKEWMHRCNSHNMDS